MPSASAFACAAGAKQATQPTVRAASSTSGGALLPDASHMWRCQGRCYFAATFSQLRFCNGHLRPQCTIGISPARKIS